MEDLQGENVQHIMAGLDVPDVKHEPSDGSVGIKCLWSVGDTQLGTFEVLPESIKVKSPPSPEDGLEPIEDGRDDQILGNELTVDHEEPVSEEENSVLNSDMGDNSHHMLHVADTDNNILSSSAGNIVSSSSLTGDITSHASQDVLQLLLPTSEENSVNPNGCLQSLNLDTVTMSSGELVTQPVTQTIQAITLADGNTAFIQHPGGSKFMEGQTITLDDGSTAVVQALPDKLNLMSPIQAPGVVRTDGNTALQLEDTTSGFFNHVAKDGLQAIILEDGTTAYLATQQTPGGGLIDNTQLEATTLTLDQLTSPVSGIPTVLSNGLTNVEGKPLALSTESEVAVVQNSDNKAAVVMQNYSTEKVGPFLEKAYKCCFEGCGKYYTTLHHLRVHERSHTGDRPFKCEFEHCGKAFATGYGLKSHTRVHTGEKPYKCLDEGCDKAFKTSGDLQKHVRTHTGERPFKCPFEGCTRSFTTSNIRKVHIRTHTGERPYICPEEGCGRAFASATNYKNHVRIHTGEKPYVCTVMGCGKRFTEYSSLYKHHVVHTHAKPYTCSRCGKTYRQTSTLAMHKRTTHGEDVTAASEALLYQEQNQAEALEPPSKRMRLPVTMINQADIHTDEGEGTLIINSSDASQQLTLVSSEGLVAGSDVLQTSLTNQNALLQQAGMALTLSDQGQQVFVITDPAQLEALQQIAKHQMDSDEQSLLTTALNSDVVIPTADTNSNNVTMVTEITTAEGLNKDISETVTVSNENDVQNM
ncbi:nucleic acid-templated transcription [Mactra antiquata]